MAGKPMSSRYPINGEALPIASERPKLQGTTPRQNALYSSPPVRMPSLEELKRIARDQGLDLSQEELQAYGPVVQRQIERINEASKLPEPRLPVKYPRMPGRKPTENKYNAWSVVCGICGAPSGKLQGKKIGVKDNIAVAGVPLQNGCHAMEGYMPDFDATVVTRVLDEGGEISGKMACEDLCYSGSSFTGANGPVLNPYDTERSAGGSSSGCAVAIAVGDVDMAIGTDQGGSIRIPAAWCGVVGMKPTYGLVPYTGAISMEPTIDHIGPMARNVDDCALLLEVIAGYDDGLDHRQHSTIREPKYTEEIKNLNLDDESVGVLLEGFDSSDGDWRVHSLVYKTLDKLSESGLKVEEVSVPMHKNGPTIFSCFSKEGISEASLQNGGGGYGNQGFYPTSMMAEIGKAFKARPNDTSHRNKLTRIVGQYLKENYQGCLYAKGRNLVLNLRKAYDKALQNFGVLAMPTIPYTAVKLPSKDCSISEQFNLSSTCTLNTTPFNCTGHPAITVPVGTVDRLPVGITLVGRHFDEVRLFRVAKAIEDIQQRNEKPTCKKFPSRL
ncbi:amidase-like [Diadema antillarum]|uniref:amidase-like n=1 Tax=Diadema antillarum TaxID=105358 RepID=UPI003A8483DC